MTTGGCLCGAVRYEATGEPYHVTHCHCLDCRRSSGAPFVTWASFRRQNVRFTREQPREVTWEERVRLFCPQCGTSLGFRSSPESEELDLTVSSFDDPTAVTPADHIWVEDKLPWIALCDGLPTHPQHRT